MTRDRLEKLRRTLPLFRGQSSIQLGELLRIGVLLDRVIDKRGGTEQPYCSEPVARPKYLADVVPSVLAHNAPSPPSVLFLCGGRVRVGGCGRCGRGALA
jgi:hypothetical protein